MMTTSTSVLDAGLDSVEGDGGGVGAVLLGAHGRDADTRAPRLELVGGGGAEGVGCAEQHLAVLGDENAGELADGGRLAGAVDADDEDHGRTVADPAARDAAVHVGLHEGEQVLAQPAAHRGLVGRAVDLDLLTQRLDELHRGLDAEVGEMRVSSTSSQASSSRRPRESSASRPCPSAPFDRASRARSRWQAAARRLGAFHGGHRRCRGRLGGRRRDLRPLLDRGGGPGGGGGRQRVGRAGRLPAVEVLGGQPWPGRRRLALEPARPRPRHEGRRRTRQRRRG